MFQNGVDEQPGPVKQTCNLLPFHVKQANAGIIMNPNC